MSKPLLEDLKGKVAIVTGAASGIGRATALLFAERGADVVVADVNDDGGERTRHMIEEMGKKAIYVKCDVAREVDVKYMVERAVKTFGRLDYAFNNAGVEGEMKSIIDTTEDQWDRLMNINLKGAWLCMKHELNQMIAQGTGGAIVNCASIAGVVGFNGASTYCASKHGMVGLTKAAALEYAKSKIRINAVCPGVIKTPMIDRFTHGSVDAEKQLIAGEPMGRLGAPEEIASGVLWLCSQGASFVTGQSLIIDGGWVAQ